jgi:hypothetical protein
MSVQLFSGKLIFGSILLANAGLGAVYRSIAPKFTLLSKIPLKPQMKAFALATVVQGIFMNRYPPQKNEGFSKRKAFEVLAPYLLISGSIYFQHRQAFKANIMSSAVLGTVQLAVSQLSPKMIDNQASTVPKDFVPEDMAFGKNNWSQYFGEVGEVPAFPEDISEILKAPCPFILGKQVGDTHTLVLIPQKVDARPFTLNLLEELIKNPKEKNKSKFSYYDESFKTELGKKEVQKSYWVLMTKDVIPESRFKPYKEQKQLVQEKGLGRYEIPSAIEATASILMHFFQTDEVLYGRAPFTYTRCQEKILDDQRTTAIGGFSRGGLVVTYPYPFDRILSYGAAAVRKF